MLINSTIMKIYTKSGDKGTTSLIGGERVAKCDLRVEAYGSVDELTAYVALLADTMRGCDSMAPIVEELHHIESRLMGVAALLAVGCGGESKIEPLRGEYVVELERAIDMYTEELRPITKFTIPGGHRVVSLCHVCRTVCRRAERAALRAADITDVDASALCYLNRLSDYFYTLGRLATERLGVEEVEWIP